MSFKKKIKIQRFNGMKISSKPRNPLQTYLNQRKMQMPIERLLNVRHILDLGDSAHTNLFATIGVVHFWLHYVSGFVEILVQRI